MANSHLDTLFGPEQPPRDGSDVLAALKAAAQERILVLDGAMGTEIQTLKLVEENFPGERFSVCSCHRQGNNDLLTLRQPAAIEDIHYRYALDGADILETNAFSSSPFSQADYGMQDMV